MDAIYGFTGLTPSNSGLFEPYNSQKLFSYDELNQYSNLIFDYQQKIWNREDTAYQRMVQDMKAAGLNPWTGVVSGGSATSSNNPASDALSGLIAGLNYNLQMTKLYNKQEEQFDDHWLSIGKMITNLLSSGISAAFKA